MVLNTPLLGWLAFIIVMLLVGIIILWKEWAISKQANKELQQEQARIQQAHIEENYRMQVQIKELQAIAAEMKLRPDFDILSNHTELEHSVFFAGFKAYEKSVLNEIDNFFSMLLHNSQLPDSQIVLTPEFVAFINGAHQTIIKQILALNE